MIPRHISIKTRRLSDAPGVYLYYDKVRGLLYVGMASSLKRRVSSYFHKAHDGRIAQMVSKITKIEIRPTPTVIEALVLEANLIKQLRPHYNVLARDDKSFLYLAITREDFPRPLLARGHELAQEGIDPWQRGLSPRAKKKYLAVFGPYTSGHALRRALDLVRRGIPWSTCSPPKTPPHPPLVRGGIARVSPLYKGGLRGVSVRPCFDAQLGKCPGVCVGAVSKKEYRAIIRRLVLFFEGKKKRLLARMRRQMQQAARAHRFEDAAHLHNAVFALEHIQDVALITGEDRPYSSHAPQLGIDLNGRIEAYDISNISGTSAVGSMVVFENGKPAKDQYRKFKIKTVKGANDVAMMEEVMRRRLRRAISHPKAWPLPQIMVIDGGEGQVACVRRVMRELKELEELKVRVPVIGIAKGFDRKQDRLVYDAADKELAAVALRGKELFQRARDEAHRFAVAYHRKLRGMSLRGRRPKQSS